MPKEQLVTVSLPSLVSMVLGGDYWHSRPIPPDVAEQIFLLTKNQHTCYIEFNDELSNHLAMPLLWDFAAWQNACEHRARTKAYSRKLFVEHELLKINTKLVGKAFAEFSGCDAEQAEQIVNKLLREKSKKIKAFFDGELVSKLEGVE